jgi:hypothetical protein
VRPFVREDTPKIALTHVRVIDGTGTAARADQTLLIEDGKIAAMGDAATTRIPDGTKTLDLTARTVIPGLVGMHDHMYYPSPGRSLPLYPEHASSFPRLYLAGGVTSIRTTGSIETYTDLELKLAIDQGKMAGPRIHVTGPYLEGKGSFTPQMRQLTDAEDARHNHRRIGLSSDEPTLPVGKSKKQFILSSNNIGSSESRSSRTRGDRWQPDCLSGAIQNSWTESYSSLQLRNAKNMLQLESIPRGTWFRSRSTGIGLWKMYYRDTFLFCSACMSHLAATRNAQYGKRQRFGTMALGHRAYLAWLSQFRRLRLRYEKRADMYEALLSLACALICWNFLQSYFRDPGAIAKTTRGHICYPTH